MKKIIISTVFLLGCLNTISACEICGCSTGNYYIGLLPQFSHKFMGVRYQFRSFKTTITNNPNQFSNDYFKTVEVWGGWNIGKKLQLLAILPYNFIHQVTDDGKVNKQGIGDIAVMANYKLFDNNTVTARKRAFMQQLWLGFGIKLPTGKFRIEDISEEIAAKANTQLGTASTDFMLNAMYNAKINKVGINTNVAYKLNTGNSDKYTFGNKFSANSFVYYAIQKKSVSILPNIGLLYENNQENKLFTRTVAQTGGHLFASSAGVEVTVKAITIGVNAQLPVSQNFSNGQTVSKLRGMAHVTFSF